MGLQLAHKCDSINSNKQVFLFILRQELKPKDRFHLGWLWDTAGTEARCKLCEHSDINTTFLEGAAVVNSGIPAWWRETLWRTIRFIPQVRVREFRSEFKCHQMWVFYTSHHFSFSQAGTVLAKKRPDKRLQMTPAPDSECFNAEAKLWGGWLSTTAASHTRHVLSVSHAAKQTHKYRESLMACGSNMSSALLFLSLLLLLLVVVVKRPHSVFNFSVTLTSHCVHSYSYQQNQFVIRNNH